ncbi:MAG TPA: helix-turn-helix domain-containing protein, partial [Savagea sp.]
QIAKKRRLKVSTIQDHVIEIAYTVEAFPYERFIEPALFEQIRQQLSNRKDQPLKELKEQYSMLSYFQIRLILTSL